MSTDAGGVSVWLVETYDATPLYVSTRKQTASEYALTPDPWFARRFDGRADAEAFAADQSRALGCLLRVVSHGFPEQPPSGGATADAGEVRLWRYRYGPNGEYGEGWDDCKPSCRSADEPIRVDEEFLAFPLAQAEAMLRVVEALRCEEAYSHARESNDWMAPLSAAGWDGMSSPRTFLHKQRRSALAALATLPSAHGGEGGGA